MRLLKYGVIVIVAVSLALTAVYYASQPEPTLHPPSITLKEERFRVEVVAEGLEIPWSMAFSKDGRLFFTERVGAISVVDSVGAEPRVVGELPVAHVGEAGLLGLALDPQYPGEPYLYAYYTYREGGELWNRVVRLIDKNGWLRESLILVDGIPGAAIHDGGRVRFGPDGKLYVTTGDAAKSELSQDPDSLAGKVLRINPDGSIPEDNPFPGSPIYSFGHRNPQGLDWHPLTKRLVATEHGPVGNDEVNIIEAGENYGWPVVQGMANTERFADPIAVYTPAVAPSGATFYSGGVFASWKDSFFFATLRGEHLRRIVFDELLTTIKFQERLLEGEYGRIRDIVEGPDGYLYLCTSNRDGRGSPEPRDDKIIRLIPE